MWRFEAFLLEPLARVRVFPGNKLVHRSQSAPGGVFQTHTRINFFPHTQRASCAVLPPMVEQRNSIPVLQLVTPHFEHEGRREEQK